MIKAAFVTLHANWPWKRQLPGGRRIFQDVEFFANINEADIVFVYDALPDKKLILNGAAITVFVASEPENVKRYNYAFLAQFDAVITSDRKTPHPRRIFVQAGLPWHAGSMSAGGKLLGTPMVFEDFENHEPRKTRLVSVVSSDKTFTAEHRARLAFVARIKEEFGDKIDVFGRGIKDFDDKIDVLDSYRYHISLENYSVDDYWTEKIADPYLTLTFPIYHGCPNIIDYFPEASLRSINIFQPDEAIEIIKEVLDSDLAERNRVHLLEARRRVMYEHNVFGILAKISKELITSRNKSLPHRTIVLRQENEFMPTLYKVRMFFSHKIKKNKSIFEAIKLIISITAGLTKQITHVYKYITDSFYRSHQNYIMRYPNEEIRFQYDLPLGAKILDVGGYYGDFAARFVDMCNANVTVFEPIPSFAARIEQRFFGDTRVHVHEAGLSNKDQALDFDFNGDASGAFRSSDGQKVKVSLWDAERFLSQCQTIDWHLVKLNIEGGEYDLLNYLIDTGSIEKFKYIQVQFHLHVTDARKQYRKLAKRLGRTHRLQWRYPFVWESWVRREDFEKVA